MEWHTEDPDCLISYYSYLCKIKYCYKIKEKECCSILYEVLKWEDCHWDPSYYDNTWRDSTPDFKEKYEVIGWIEIETELENNGKVDNI